MNVGAEGCWCACRTSNPVPRPKRRGAKPGTAMKDEAFPSEQLIDMERKMLLSNSAGISFAFEPYWEAQKEFVMSRLSPEDLPTFVSILNEKGERKAIQFFSEKYSN